MELYSLGIKELGNKLKKGEITSADICKSLLERIERINPKINAYVNLDLGFLQKKAKESNVSSYNNFLAGIPLAIKDNICVKGELTTCASRILSGFRPPYDATVIQKIKKSNAIPFGKVNMDEFAFGSSTETSCYGPVCNPWDLSRIPGGSSGGSAAAVASDIAVAALGSDTGGSIRQPAALTGVVGMKPTYGRISRYGLLAFASSLDQIGPIAKTVEDCALLLSVISGYDTKDSTSVNTGIPDFQSTLSNPIKGMKIGIPKEYFKKIGIEKDVYERIEESIRLFSNLGAEIIDVSLPHTEYAISTYYIIASSEASSNLARYDGVQYGLRLKDASTTMEMYKKTRNMGFGNEAKRRIILGTYALSSGYYDAYYLRAMKVRTKMLRDFEEVFKICDCLLTPTSPTVAFKMGEKLEDPLSMYLSDVFTIPVNLAGLPAISIPCGFSKAKGTELPIGLQLIGNYFKENLILQIAYNFEQKAQVYKIKPEGL